MLCSFFIVFKTNSQDTIVVTYNNDIPSSFDVYDETCNGPLSILSATLPAGDNYEVLKVDVSYSMSSLGTAQKLNQRSKIRLTNTGAEEVEVSGTGNTGGIQDYTREISLASGIYPGGTPLNFEMWVRRTLEDIPGCNTSSVRVNAFSWTMTIYLGEEIKSPRVGVNTSSPKEYLDVRSESFVKNSTINLGNPDNTRFTKLSNASLDNQPAYLAWNEDQPFSLGTMKNDTANLESLIFIDTTGKIGINTKTPTADFELVGSLGLNGLLVTKENEYAIEGISDTGNSSIGVVGRSNSEFGKGIEGRAYASSGFTRGVSGFSTSPDGTGVYGWATSSNGENVGVFGESWSLSGYGVMGENSNNLGGRGVYGKVVSQFGVGVFGHNTSTVSGSGVIGQSNGNGKGVYGNALGASGVGVYGITEGLSGYGLHGINTAPTGAAISIYGEVNSEDGIAIKGDAKATLGVTYGVQGISKSPSGIGVYGNANSSTGLTRGIYGLANATDGKGVEGSSSGQFGKGVYGNAMGESGKAFEGVSSGLYGKGIYVKVNSEHSSSNAILAEWGGGSSYAGYFIGRTHIAGTLSKSAGSFKIDHPQDSANKYLSHSFVESPDMMNIYNGNVVTDNQGNAIVKLPEYFESLNIDFRYQLTVIGEFAQAIISKEIYNNQFEIRSDKPGIKVSWQVTGVRNDPYARENRIKVEENKETENIGKYLHPELYNVNRSRMIGTDDSKIR